MIIEISENATLKELDQFIRDIWVECCGHLSSFEVNGSRYESVPYDEPWGMPAKNMNDKLKDVFILGGEAMYEYDFGFTTELILNINGYRTGSGKKEKIVILSRNNLIEILCSQCEKNTAVWVDPEGVYEGNPFWCDECVKEEEMETDEDEMDDFDLCGVPECFLPVCNSPRMGVCGYEGSTTYPDQFKPDRE